MTKEIEKIIARFKAEVGKSKGMTTREMKLIEICYDEFVVKNCIKPVVSNSLASTIGRNCPYCGERCTECGHKED